MMTAGVVSSRVYEAVKRQVLSGVLLPGVRLDPARLADELASSVTPVRDALQHLVGEMLVDARPNEGFFLPQLNEPLLRDRYSWLDLIARLALGPPNRNLDLLPSAVTGEDYTTAIRQIYEGIAICAENVEHRGTIAAMIDRLEAVRTAEERALPDCKAELNDLADAMTPGNTKRVTSLMSSFTRRRMRAASSILIAVYRR